MCHLFKVKKILWQCKIVLTTLTFTLQKKTIHIDQSKIEYFLIRLVFILILKNVFSHFIKKLNNIIQVWWEKELLMNTMLNTKLIIFMILLKNPYCYNPDIILVHMYTFMYTMFLCIQSGKIHIGVLPMWLIIL